MKKLVYQLILITFLSLVLLLPVFAASSESGSCGEHLTWTLKQDGTLTIRGIGDMENYSAGVYTPWFSQRDRIHTVIVDAGVAGISEYAFEDCYAMENVYFPISVTQIGENAFRSCHGLTDVYYSGDALLWSEVLCYQGNTILSTARLHLGQTPKGPEQAELVHVDEQTEGYDTVQTYMVYCASEKNALAWMACYAESGQFLGVESPVTLVRGGKTALQARITSGVKARVFVLDEAQKPLTPALSASEMETDAEDDSDLQIVRVSVNEKLASKAVNIESLSLALSRLDLTGAPTVYINGAAVEDASFALGDEVAIYLNRQTEIVRVDIVRLTFARVCAVYTMTDEELAMLEAGDTSTRMVHFRLVTGELLTVPERACLDLASHDGEFVLAAIQNDKVVSYKQAPTVSGRINATKDYGRQCRINGAWYQSADSWFSLGTDINTEAVWALDSVGQLCAMVSANTDYNKSYAVVYDVTVDPDNHELYRVFYSEMDGSLHSRIAYSDERITMGGLISIGKQMTVTAYRIQDGRFLVTEGAYDLRLETISKTREAVNLTENVSADADTYFLRAWRDDYDLFRTTVVKGYQNAVLQDALAVICCDGNTAVYVITNDSILPPELPARDIHYAVLVSDVPIVTVDTHNNVIYIYEVIIDGKDAELQATAEITTVAAGQVFEYETENGFVSNATALTDKVKVAFVDGNQVVIEGVADVYSQANAKVYAFDKYGGIQEGQLRAGQSIILIAEDQNILYAFIAYEPKQAAGYAVLMSVTPVITVDDDNNNIYTYDVIIDGKEATLKAAAEITTVAEGQVFEYETENGYVSIATALTDKVKVAYVDGNQVEIEGAEAVYSQANAKVYAFDQDGAIAEGELKAGQTIILIADKQNIVYAFIDYEASAD